MGELPADICATIPSDAWPAVERWWTGLSADDRRTAAEQWDERRESHFFAPQADETGSLDAWEGVPDVIGGRFVPHDDSVRMHEWLEEWHAYLLGHEEVVLLPRVVIVFRTFHICQTEPAARAVTARGCLPAEFRCPLASDACPMRRVQTVAPGRTFYLAPAASGGWWVVAPWVTHENNGDKGCNYTSGGGD